MKLFNFKYLTIFFLFSFSSFGKEIKFPKEILLKSKHETKNERFEFFLSKKGKVYFREPLKGDESSWGLFPMPEILMNKKISAIAADNRYIIFLDTKGQVFKTKDGRKDASEMNWTSKWGHPVGMGKGLKIHSDAINWDIQDWSWLKKDDVYVTDPLTRARYRTISIAHIFMIFDEGQRISVHDPFLPTDDYSYQICLPHRNRFKAKSFSGSGGFVFIMNQYGDMYTRLWNLDLAGYNQIYARYSYEDPKVEHSRHTALFEFFKTIRLPSPDWKKQPKIKGKITDNISIFKKGKGTVEAILRVEGIRNGKLGVFEKSISDKKWIFRVTNHKKNGTFIENKPYDSTTKDLAPKKTSKNFHFNSRNYELILTDFKVHCSPDKFVVKFRDGSRLPLKFHSRGIYRLSQGPIGLTDQKLKYRGALEISKEVFNNIKSQPKMVQSFLKSILKKGNHKRFVSIKGWVTKEELFIKSGYFSGVRWTLTSR